MILWMAMALLATAMSQGLAWLEETDPLPAAPLHEP